MTDKINKFIIIIFFGILYILSFSINIGFFLNYNINFKFLKSKYIFFRYLNGTFNSSVRDSAIREIIQLSAIVKYFCSNRINNSVYIGKNFWMFYLENSSKIDFIGKQYFSVEEKLDFKNSIDDINNCLNEKNIKFILLIAPNKEQIYYTNMPKIIIKNNQFNRTDDLLKYLNKNFIVYPKKEMINYSKDYQLYYKYDTHWSELGAFVAMQEINKIIYNNKQFLNEMEIIKDYFVIAPNDIPRMFYFENILKENYQFRIENKFFLSKYKKKKVILIGDSFRTTFASILNFQYSVLSVFDINSSSITIEDIIKKNPDILILETVERNQKDIIKIISRLLCDNNK